MKLLRFEGYSDDTFACTGPGIDVDLDTCASGAPVYMRVEAGKDSMIVCGQYAPGPVAGWIIGVGPDDGEIEDKPVPGGRALCARARLLAVASHRGTRRREGVPHRPQGPHAADNTGRARRPGRGAAARERRTEGSDREMARKGGDRRG